MKIALDLFPILLFFAAYKFASIYEATAVLMAATVVQSLLLYRLDGKLATLQKVTLALILVFGTLTLVLHDDRFIKFKPTLLYGCMALGLFVAQFLFKKNFLKTMLGSQPARCQLANFEHGMDPLLHFHVSVERVCSLLLQHRRLGEFQNMGLHFSLDLHCRNGFLHCQACAACRKSRG